MQHLFSSLETLKCFLQKLKIKKIFLVCGQHSFVVSGAKEFFLPLLKRDLHIHVAFFTDFANNPRYEDILIGVQKCKEANCDMIIGIGGGSTLDMAKSIRAFSAYEVFLETNTLKRNTKPLLPLIAIPLTSGTGAEATQFSVIYKDERKFSLLHHSILPDGVYLSSEFTNNMGAYLTACTGFDAFSQAVEAYWNINATNHSDKYALKAIRLLWENNRLLYTVQNPLDNKYRASLSEAAYLSGKAINITQTTAPHAFSYAFTSKYAFPHGHAVALTFPFFFLENVFPESFSGMERGSSNSLERMKALLEIMKLPFNVKIVREEMQEFILRLGLTMRKLPNNSFEYIINEFNSERAKNNPVLINEALKERLLYYLNSI